MRSRTSDESTLVYSSNPTPTHTSAPARAGATLRASQAGSGTAGPEGVRIWLEKKGRNGTPVSIVRGLAHDRNALKALVTRLKRACGSGGSAKDGEIIIQGDHRERISAVLTAEGLRVKLAGG